MSSATAHLAPTFGGFHCGQVSASLPSLWKRLRQASDRIGGCIFLKLKSAQVIRRLAGGYQEDVSRSSVRVAQKSTSLRCEYAKQEGLVENGGTVLTSLPSILPPEASADIATPSKQCEKCGHRKLKVDFEETKTTADGLHGWCRACRAVYRLQRANKDLHHLAMSVEEAWEKSKACTNCNLVKEARDFGKMAAAKDGLHYWCRACMAMLQKRGPSHAPKDTPQQCSWCCEVKPANEFFKDRRKISGLASYCKACRNLRLVEEWRPNRQRLHVTNAEKRCTRCGQVKESAEFSKNKVEPDGLRRTCRECVADNRKARIQRDKDTL